MLRKTLPSWPPLVVFGLIILAGPRPAGLRAAPVASSATAPAAAPAAGGLHLVTAAGQPLDLNKFRGKAVFVNLWATWCPPCRTEMPGIAALAARTDTSKVAFVLISLDKSPAKALKFMQRQGLPLPVYFPASPLPPPFNSPTVPTTIILSPDGYVAARYEGLVDYDTPEFGRALERLAGRR